MANKKTDLLGGNISDSGTTAKFWQVDANKETGVTITSDGAGGAIIQNNKKAARETTTLNATDVLIGAEKTSIKTEIATRKIKDAGDTASVKMKIDEKGTLTATAEGVPAPDTDARSQIKKVQGTTNWNDEPAISLKDAKTAIDGKLDKTAIDEYKIKNAVNGKNTTVKVENGILTVDAEGGGTPYNIQGHVTAGNNITVENDGSDKVKISATASSGTVKSVNNKLPDGQGAVNVYGTEIKRKDEAGSKNITESIDSLETSRELTSNKSGQISGFDDVKYPNITAVMTFVSTAITTFETTIKSWVNTQLAGYYTKTETDAKLDNKAEKSTVEALAGVVATKADTTYVNAELAKKVNESNFVERVQGIVNSMELNASKIKSVPVDLTGLKDGEGIGYNDALKKFLPAKLGGESQWKYVEGKPKMAYNDTKIISSKDIPALKNGHWFIVIHDEEYEGSNHDAQSIMGESNSPAAQFYVESYYTYDGERISPEQAAKLPEADVVYEIKITKLAGTTTATDVTIGLIVYMGLVEKLNLPSAQYVKGMTQSQVAQIRGAMDAISETKEHVYSSIYRNGNDLELLSVANIDASWRKAVPIPCVTINKERPIIAMVNPGFIKGKPTIKGIYTNCGGKLTPEANFFINVSLCHATKKNAGKLGTWKVRQYPAKINWSGVKDTVGNFEVTWVDDVIDCRALTIDDLGALAVKVEIISESAAETMDIVSLKMIWESPVIEREL